MSEATPGRRTGPQATDAAPADDTLPGALAGDLDAGFFVLVQTYERVVFSLAARLSDTPSDAEDLAAETFVRAYRALRGYPPERIVALAPRAWLVTILLNLWRNSLRTKARRPRSVALDHCADTPSTERSVTEWVEHDEAARHLATMVRRLPADQRTAVVLRHVGDLSIAEIAEAMGCPGGTVKSHISRGLTRLRAMYAEAGPAGRTTREGDE